MGDVYNIGGGGLLEDTLLSYYIVLFIAIIILSLLMVIKCILMYIIRYKYEPEIWNLDFSIMWIVLVDLLQPKMAAMEAADLG